jgi:hypothetical protein
MADATSFHADQNFPRTRIEYVDRTNFHRAPRGCQEGGMSRSRHRHFTD